MDLPELLKKMENDIKELEAHLTQTNIELQRMIGGANMLRYLIEKEKSNNSDKE